MAVIYYFFLDMNNPGPSTSRAILINDVQLGPPQTMSMVSDPAVRGELSTMQSDSSAAAIDGASTLAMSAATSTMTSAVDEDVNLDFNLTEDDIFKLLS